jgi:hypothetical protein
MNISGVNFTGGFIVTPAVDPQFNYVTALLHGDGASAGTNNTFLDSSTNNFAITRNGSATQGSFAPYGTLWSNYFGTTTSNFKFASSASFAIGTGNFTIQCSVNFTAWASTNQRIVLQGVSGTSNVEISRDSGANELFVVIQNSRIITYAWVPNIGQWYDIALVRSGTGTNQVVLYIDGVSVATGTSSASIAQNQFIVGGLDWGSGYSVQGYISNLRYSNIARTIGVPTSPYTSDANTIILTCQSNRFVDNSSNAFAVTVNGTPSVQIFSPFGATTAYSSSVIGGSGYFNGSTASLTIAGTSTACALPGDFTIECWYYQLATTNYGSLFSTTSTYSTANSLRISTGPTNNTIQVASAGSAIFNASTTFTPSTWVHFALVRSGSTVTLYQNGVSVGSATNSQSFVSDTFIIGDVQGVGSPYYINGYLSNLRIVKGTAVYTSAFTPPTAPLTAITNTQLLLSLTNGQIFDNGMMNNFITAGSAQVSTSVVKYGTGSIFINGSGNYLTMPSTVTLGFGTSDFTIEGWLYLVSTSSYSTIISNRTSDTDNTAGRWSVAVRTSAFEFFSGGSQIVSSGTVSTSTWTHFAVSRSSGSLRLFLNGTQVGSTTSFTTSLSTLAASIGANGAGTEPLTGYIDELRITNGFARYTSNFTAPTSQFPSTGPIPIYPPTVEYLVVAGGGGGGSAAASSGLGGGGGAGGFRTSVTGAASGGGGSAETVYTVTGGTAITVTVGAGGTAVTGNNRGNTGSNSVFGTITSTGGGGGSSGDSGIAASTGGSGGGGGNGGGGVTRAGAAGTTNQGYGGGTSTNPGQNYPASGGGGAGAVGAANPTNLQGGAGGAGVSSSITGSAVTYGGGGGGGINTFNGGASPGAGGAGGGGAGGINTFGTAGTVNTGGGGGGSGGDSATGGGAGGSGIVSIRYSTSFNLPSSTTGSPSVTTVGGYNIYTWTSSGSITF